MIDYTILKMISVGFRRDTIHGDRFKSFPSRRLPLIMNTLGFVILM